jgi:hypothetical protein
LSPNTCVVLHDDGISLVLDLTDGHLPAVVHWGADIGDLTAEDAAALMRAGTVPTARNGSVTHSAPLVDLSPALNAHAGPGRAAKRHE